jgi:hypothetical protein
MEQSIGREELSKMTQKADWWEQHLEDSVAIWGGRLQEAVARRLELELSGASKREIGEALRYEREREETWAEALRLLDSLV